MTDNFLYKYPALYEQLYECSAADTCLEFFKLYLRKMPAAVLDIGCGTGRDLHRLAQHCAECVGVDPLPSMIEYAVTNYPGVMFELGDMRDARLRRTFDVVMTLGSGLNYMLTNEDLERAMKTFRVHCRPGALLIIETHHTSVGATGWPTDFLVTGEGFTARGKATYEWDAVTQVVKRRRVWIIDNGRQEYEHVDLAQVRLLFAQELRYILQVNGFTALDILERPRSKHYGKTMYVVARCD